MHKLEEKEPAFYALLVEIGCVSLTEVPGWVREFYVVTA